MGFSINHQAIEVPGTLTGGLHPEPRPGAATEPCAPHSAAKRGYSTCGLAACAPFGRQLYIYTHINMYTPL